MAPEGEPPLCDCPSPRDIFPEQAQASKATQAVGDAFWNLSAAFIPPSMARAATINHASVTIVRFGM